MAKVKKVFKYGTGDIIPDGAIYLSTQTETEEREVEDNTYNDESDCVRSDCIRIKSNLLVWHYFLIEVEE